jgi:prolyl-tRNA synthetase
MLRVQRKMEMKITLMNGRDFPRFTAAFLVTGLFLLATLLRAQSNKGTVVEQIVARVNNEIITLSEYQQADQELKAEVAQDCQACTPDKIQAEIKDQEKDLLRGLIDSLAC